MKRTESTLTGDDGTAIFVRHWAPDDGATPKGTVTLVHGLVEHSGRYEELAAALVRAGFLVYASDHRGHGRTVVEERDLGHFADSDGWERVLADLQVVARHVESAHPELPRAIVAHSMGTFLALETVLRAPSAYAAVVLSASKGGGGPLAAAGLVAAKLERARLGRRGRSPILNFLSFGAYNLQFRGSRTGSDWLSRDAHEVDKYLADPRCGFIATTQLWVDLLGGIAQLGKVERYAALQRDVPFLLFAGSDDPVANQPPPIEALHATLEKAGLRRLTLRRYPGGRHEMFHEINRDEVFADVVRFLEEALE